MKRFFLLLCQWLGAPAFILRLEEELSYQKSENQKLWEEIKLLRDAALLKHGTVGIHTPPNEPSELAPSSPSKEWLKQDITEELEELKRLARQDPESFGPIYEEALLKYREEFKS